MVKCVVGDGDFVVGFVFEIVVLVIYYFNGYKVEVKGVKVIFKVGDICL